MQDKAIIEAQLSRVLSFFPRVENRISGLFATNTLLLAALAINVDAQDLRFWYVTVPGVLALLGLIVSYVFLYIANFPQSRGGEQSLVYFSEIRKRTEANYIAEFLGCDEARYRTDMLGQVWRNSQILCDKYRHVKHAIISTSIALIPFFLFLGATAYEHSRIPLIKG